MWYGYGNDVRPEVDFDFFAFIKIDVDQNVLSHSGACVPKRTVHRVYCFYLYLPMYDESSSFIKVVRTISTICMDVDNCGVLKFVTDIISQRT